MKQHLSLGTAVIDGRINNLACRKRLSVRRSSLTGPRPILNATAHSKCGNAQRAQNNQCISFYIHEVFFIYYSTTKAVGIKEYAICPNCVADATVAIIQNLI